MNVGVNVVTAKDGTDILEIVKEDKVYRLNSLYRPDVEAEKFAQQYTELEEGSVLLVFGFGNGSFPKALLNSSAGKAEIIFYEPCVQIMEYWKQSDNTPQKILLNEGYLVTPECFQEGESFYKSTDFPKLLEKMIHYSNYKKVICLALPKYPELFPEQYKYFLGQIQYRIQFLESNMATAKVMGHTAVINNILNLKYIPKSFCADDFAGIFPKDMPVIIVSAGPSLEKNVHVLRYAKGRTVIICVDAAIKYLLRENIVPDFIISVDPRISLELFDDKRIHGIPVLGSLDMNYLVPEQLCNSDIIFCSTDNSYVKNLYQHYGHKINRLKMGGSVSTLAFSLCVYWGFQCIILIGQDLALTGGQRYAGKEKLSMEQMENELIEVEDIYGNNIYTVRDYYYYLQWFEQNIAMNPELTVIDATEGGAKIRGSRIIPLKDSVDMYAGKTYNIDAILEAVKPAFSQEERKIVWEQISNSKQTLLHLLEELNRGLELAKRGLESILNDMPDVADYQQIDNDIQKICEYYNSLDESFLIQREIDATDLEAYMRIFEENAHQEPGEKYNRLIQYFDILIKATDTVYHIWNEL